MKFLETVFVMWSSCQEYWNF